MALGESPALSGPRGLLRGLTRSRATGGWAARLRDGRFPLFPLLMGLFGVGLVLLRTSTHGPGVSHDSVYYFSLASNLTAGNGFTEFDGTGRAASVWPPGFAMILAAVGLTGADPLDASRFVNAFAFGGTVFAACSWLGRIVETRGALVLGSFAIVLSMPLAFEASYARTYPVSDFWTILSLFHMYRFLGSGKRSFLVWAAAFAALASITHYLRAAVIGAGLLLVVLDAVFRQRGKPFSERFTPTAAYSIIATAPLLVWLGRNVLATGQLIGSRGVASRSLPENFSATLATIREWLLPESWEIWGIERFALESLLLSVGPLALAVSLMGAAYKLSPRGRRPSRTGQSLIASPWATLSIFILVYFAWLMYGMSRVHTIAAFDYYASPLYVPLAILMALALERLWRGVPGPALRWAAAIGIAGFCLVFFTHTVRSNVRDVEVWLKYGGGYTSDYWMNKDIARYLRQHSLGGDIYSNAVDVVYFFGSSGAGKVHRLGDIHYWHSTGTFPEGLTHVVWIKDSDYQYNWNGEVLAGLAEQGLYHEVFEGDSGAVYRLAN